MTRRTRVAVTLVGDVSREPGASAKYGHFIEALGKRFSVVAVHDATLRGTARLINAARVVHPNLSYWRERFYKNVPAFHARSRRTRASLGKNGGGAEVVLQIGVLFDARWNDAPLPSVVYTDYTARLSALKPEAGRSPFSARDRERWIALERRAFERASHVCTRGRFVRRSIVEDYGIPPEQVTVIGGGLNFDSMPEPVTRTGRERPTVLFIGKDFHRKGGDLVLRAFAQARLKVPTARLLLLTAGGDGASGEGVQLVTPTWDRTKIAALYQSADLFVLPSRLETWGDVLLEAMAYGLPCLGVSGDSMDEIIEHDRTGLVVSPDDPDALQAALLTLLEDEALRRRLGEAARASVGERFTWDKVVERLAPLLEAAAVGGRA